MSLETGNYLSDLVSSNPTKTDPVTQGADHLKLTKKVLKTTFPGAAGQGFAKRIDAKEDELNYLVGVSSSVQGQINTTNAAISSNSSRLTALENAPAAEQLVNSFGMFNGLSVIRQEGVAIALTKVATGRYRLRYAPSTQQLMAVVSTDSFSTQVFPNGIASVDIHTFDSSGNAVDTSYLTYSAVVTA